MTQKSLLHAVAAQIANGYETAEVPMYSEQLRMPDRKVIIKIIENLQKVFFPAYFAGGTGAIIFRRPRRRVLDVGVGAFRHGDEVLRGHARRQIPRAQRKGDRKSVV